MFQLSFLSYLGVGLVLVALACLHLISRLSQGSVDPPVAGVAPHARCVCLRLSCMFVYAFLCEMECPFACGFGFGFASR